jgi:hypothetical protein
MVRIVLLSGPLAVGKTAVADVLRNRGLKKISSSGYLRQLAAARSLPDTRESLQQLGDLLDQQTDYAWLVDDVAVGEIADDTDQLDWFVDAVRKEQQVRSFREKFPDILHVHLTAPEDVLRSRFLDRAREGDGAHTEGRTGPQHKAPGGGGRRYSRMEGVGRCTAWSFFQGTRELAKRVLRNDWRSSSNSI